ncbi:MAG: TIGR03557 family F420-dependent LLM class oxidoreductase [Solirubrobacteraceae bacterium]
MRVGCFLASEEWGPKDLVRQAVMAHEAGFEDLWISDHYHPWNDEQGHSPFVWTTIGGIAQAAPGMGVTTAVTCPSVRIHPAVIAQAAATAALMLDGNFRLGVGSGEALNEHIITARWPGAEERLEMLEEAVAVIRLLWEGGVKYHRGRHYEVEHCRVYDLPERAPEILVSGFGDRAIDVAARIGDGYCTTGPDADAVSRFRSGARVGAVVQGGVKVCWSESAARAREHVHRLWPNEALPGELSQILPTPAHFEQAAELVTEEQATASVPCGPDVDAHVEAILAYRDAGFDEVYVGQIGPEQDEFFAAYREHVLPRVKS